MRYSIGLYFRTLGASSQQIDVHSRHHKVNHLSLSYNFFNETHQAIKSNLSWYADYSFFSHQHGDVEETEQRFSKNFWLVHWQLIKHTRKRKKIVRKPKVKSKKVKRKQHSQLTYLPCLLEGSFSGEPMVLKVLNKRNRELFQGAEKKNFHTNTLQNTMLFSHPATYRLCLLFIISKLQWKTIKKCKWLKISASGFVRKWRMNGCKV